MVVVRRMKNGEMDLQKLFPPSPEKKEESDQKKTGAEGKQWIVMLSKIVLDQYSLRVEDQTLPEPVALTLDQIRFRGENISTAKKHKGNLSLAFVLDKQGAVSTSGTVVVDPLQLEGSLAIKQLPLKQYSPYYRDKILFALEDGTLHFSTNFRFLKGEKGPRSDYPLSPQPWILCD